MLLEDDVQKMANTIRKPKGKRVDMYIRCLKRAWGVAVSIEYSFVVFVVVVRLLVVSLRVIDDDKYMRLDKIKAKRFVKNDEPVILREGELANVIADYCCCHY